MKKCLLILLTAASVSLLAGCHEHTYQSEWESNESSHWNQASCCEEVLGNLAAHTWQPSLTPNEKGEYSYSCSVCGYLHAHAYNAGAWASNSQSHWHPATCGHADAPLTVEDHVFADGSNVCSVCSFNMNSDQVCEVAFSYVQVDDKGNPIVDENGSYTEVGVTYESVQNNASVQVDTVNGATLYQGDKISFKVKKSVFCYYTDDGNQPLVEVITGKSPDQKKETLEPDANGVYSVTLTADTLISVANVATRPNTITGKGSAEDPFTINSVTDWLYFSNLVNDKSFYAFQYNVAYWKLNVDLDFEGEGIYVIGDGYTTESSVFCGNFDGNGHKISNFVLDNSVSGTVGQYSRYLGLFGVISSYEGVDSVISNLTVENFTVNAIAASDDIVSVGGLVGYGAGSNIRNCTVRNATINVTADDTYMSYAGGVIGYMQSAMSENGIVFYASVGYTAVENLTLKGSGMLYDAGGIVGRAVSTNDQVTSFIYNSYSTGTITGAVRSGGIAGEIQRYSTVQNSYSTAKLSANTSYTEAVIDRYVGTALDDRFAYAGGIVGYAENDTVVSGCFFAGSTSASAAAGANFAKAGKIVGDYSQAGYADYTAQGTVLTNNASEQFDADYLKNTMKWSEVDWVFGEGYPVVNTAEGSHKFSVRIQIGEEVKHTTQIDSLYIPMAYWYIIDGHGGEMKGIPSRLVNSANANSMTYGYFFDKELTKRVPCGFVPMTDITLYAAFVDTNDVVGKYYISNGGVSVKLVLNADGTYLYEEGAVLVDGNFEYDGKLVIFKNSFFSRLAETATATQKMSYYTFWAIKQEDGNLHLFDCEEQYVVTEEEEEQSATFATMARFYEKDNPLVCLSSANIQLDGGYYYADGAFKYVFVFNYDYTGSYRYYDAQGVTGSDFTYEMLENNQVAITVVSNGRKFTATTQEGVITSMTDPRGTSHTVLLLDAFVGSWEKQATTHKVYTFDGMGSWTYEHYAYLTKENVVTAVKEILVEDKGSYTVAEGVLTLTRTDGSTVKGTVSADGSVLLTENEQPLSVKYSNLNSYLGVWKTVSNKVVRYTMTLGGLNQSGIGVATISGFTGGAKSFRYQAISDKTLYLYLDDFVYAILSYDAKLGVMNGMFYDNNTGTTSSAQTFYLYDDFYGEWVSDVEGLENISFNGFGGYDKSDDTGASLAVNGVVIVGGVECNYTIDRADDSAKFAFDGVDYTLYYDEYNNEISVWTDVEVGKIVKADEYHDTVLLTADGTSYTFDGRGCLATGGKVTVGEAVADYKINADGSISITGSITQTIQPVVEEGKTVGYELADGTALFVKNSFSGTWAVSTKNVTLTVGMLAFVPKNGDLVSTTGSYNGNAVTVYYDGGNYVYFDYQTVRYYLIDTLGSKPALIFSKSLELGAEGSEEALAVVQDSYFGEWTATDGSKLKFDGCGASDYVKGTVEEINKDGSTKAYTYTIKDGVVTLYRGTSKYATFVACAQADAGAYANAGRYYKVVKAS